MSVEQEQSISTIPWRMIGSILGIVGMLALLLLALPKAEQVDHPDAVDTTDQGNSLAAKCEQDLTRIIKTFKPGGSVVLAGQAEIISQLNNWQLTCAREDAESLVAHDADLLAKVLPEPILSAVNREKFSTLDASHIQTCLLAHEIVKTVALTQKVDKIRVQAIFDFVCRYITLMPEQAASQLPLNPYDSLLFGRGTARHITWTFASVIEQLRLDAVILRPTTAQKTDYWLIGVIVPKTGVLLFDPHMGMMIPSLERDEGGFWPTSAALIDEARANDAVFRQFDNPQFKYPLAADDLQTLTVEVIGDPSGWSPRMAQLQFLLAAEFTVELYNGLGPNDLREAGLWDRVKAAGVLGGWTEDQMKVWSFPAEEALRNNEQRSAESSLLAGMLQVFSGPVVQSVDRKTGERRLGPISHPLHETRMQQLMGVHARAVENLVPIRGAGMNTQIPMNQDSGDHAEFWIGVSQYELGRYEAALNTFKRYVESHPTGGPWSRDSLEWAIRTLIASNQHQAAGALLANNIGPQTVIRDVWLLNRWGKLLGLAPVQPALAPEKKDLEMPAEPAPSTGDPADQTPSEATEKAAADQPSGESPARPPAPSVPVPAQESAETNPE